jgi:hypothetical protein
VATNIITSVAVRLHAGLRRPHGADQVVVGRPHGPGKEVGRTHGTGKEVLVVAPLTPVLLQQSLAHHPGQLAFVRHFLASKNGEIFFYKKPQLHARIIRTSSWSGRDPGCWERSALMRKSFLITLVKSCSAERLLPAYIQVIFLIRNCIIGQCQPTFWLGHRQSH